MKTLTKAFAVLALTTASFTTFAATEVNSAPAGQQSAGMVAASANNGNYDAMQENLAAKAAQEGASSYRIISTGGVEHVYGTAEIYK